MKGLGFTEDQALEAFLACERNEMVAANYLFENMEALRNEAGLGAPKPEEKKKGTIKCGMLYSARREEIDRCFNIDLLRTWLHTILSLCLHLIGTFVE